MNVNLHRDGSSLPLGKKENFGANSWKLATTLKRASAYLSLASGVSDRQIVRQFISALVCTFRLVSTILVTRHVCLVVNSFLVAFLSLDELVFALLDVLAMPLRILRLLFVVQGGKRRRGLPSLGFLPNLRCYASPGAAY